MVYVVERSSRASEAYLQIFIITAPVKSQGEGLFPYLCLPRYPCLSGSLQLLLGSMVCFDSVLTFFPLLSAPFSSAICISRYHGSALTHALALSVAVSLFLSIRLSLSVTASLPSV